MIANLALGFTGPRDSSQCQSAPLTPNFNSNSTVSRFVFFALLGLILSPLAVAHATPPPADSVHFCAPFDYEQWRRDHPRPAGKGLANQNVGEPRTVRMVYFLPNDRPYRAAVIDSMKATIKRVQTFYAEQMQAHGYGNRTFRFETDVQGEPVVHRVDGRHPDSYYLDDTHIVYKEVERAFDLAANIYLVAVDNSINAIGIGGGRRAGGTGSRVGKSGGQALIPSPFAPLTVAHELGHAFGLQHDFNDDTYIMSYGGPRRARLSSCSAEYLAVHPYFNPNSPLAEGSLPTIKLTSSLGYPVGAKRVSVQLKVRDSDGLHQVLLFVPTREPHSAAGYYEVKTCRGLASAREAVVEFDYDGIVPSHNTRLRLSDADAHPIHIKAVDRDGNFSYASFTLSPHLVTTWERPHPSELVKVSGDGQEGAVSTQLAAPFVVSVLDRGGSPLAGVAVTFSVATGGGMLSSTTTTNSCAVGSSTSSATTTTDANGRASTKLTLGSDAGTNKVTATVEGLAPVTFTATAAEQARPDRLTKVCGDSQAGTVSIQLAVPFVVSVSAENGAAMAGVLVSFAVTAGGGMLSSAMATTDANGRASTWLTLGSELGSNTVTATVSGLAPVTFTATGQASPLSRLFGAFGGSGKRVVLLDSTQLLPNAPNPFNSQTVLAYFLREPGRVRLEVFALSGQRVAVLHHGMQEAGYHRLHWDGRDAAGHPVASGAYLYRLVTDETVLTRKLTLLR